MTNSEIGKRAVHGKSRGFSYGCSMLKCLDAMLFKTSSILLNSYGVRPIGAVEVNAFHAGGVVRTNRGVAKIFAPVGLSKIFNSVIASVSVYMVNVASWPFSVLIKPSKSMCSVVLAVNSNNHIAGWLQRPANRTHA